MWYDLTKYIYNNLKDYARSECWWKSKELKECSENVRKGINSTGRYTKLYDDSRDFNKFKRMMIAYISINKEAEDTASRDSQAICEKFGEYSIEMFSKKLCTFYYFLINEMDAWKNGNFETYISLLKNAGVSYSPASYENMEDVITMHIMRTDNSFGRWVSLMSDWNQQVQNCEYAQSMTPPFIGENENRYSLTLGKLNELLASGRRNQDNTQGTRMSLNQITMDMDKILNNQDAQKIEELFRGYDRTIELILDTETRRQWYFLKIIYDVIERQVDDLIDAAENKNEESFNEIKGHLWMENGIHNINMHIPWCDITIDRYTFDEIEKAAEGSYITGAKVAEGFHECLDEYRYVEKVIGGDEIEILQSLIFESAKIIGGEFVDDDEYDARNRIGHQYSTGMNNFRKHIFEGRRVTKEFLLLTVLVAFVNGIEYPDDYIKEHVLYNSRYPIELNEMNLFTKFYNETIIGIRKIGPGEGISDVCLEDRIKFIEERKSFMRRKAAEYLKRYFILTQRSLFYDILMGHEIF